MHFYNIISGWGGGEEDERRVGGKGGDYCLLYSFQKLDNFFVFLKGMNSPTSPTSSGLMGIGYTQSRPPMAPTAAASGANTSSIISSNSNKNPLDLLM